MNKLKYIPGDLIKSDRIPNSIWKIEEVLQDKYWEALYRCVDARNDIYCTNLYKHRIVPIPITKEILEKNGWFEDSFLDNYKSFYKNDRNYPSLHGQQAKDGYIYDVDFGEETIITNIKYVHQLQHLLFGLGLPMDLKV